MNNIYVRLAKTNIQNNRQLYLPYIISGIVTVMMFYLMMFINNNPGLKSIPGSANLKTIMALGVGIITIFAYIFIFYTNSFISKRRKKEIGVYNILGMEKVGMSNAEVKASIQSQIRIVFFLPLVMAAVHVAAAFPMIRRLLAMLSLTNVSLFVTCLLVTILVFTAIYYLVFRITSRAYYKIVSR